MEISQLRTIIHVSELGSLSKAADRLNIAQPALSRQVRMLEEELGVPLFYRHGRGMVITDAGQEVLRHAQRVLGELEEIRACVSGEDASLRGHVSIGMPPTVADILTESLVSVFQERHPEATLRIVSAYSVYLLDWLQRGDVDVAILFETRSSRTLRSTHLLQEELHLIGSNKTQLDPSVTTKFSDLGNRKLLLPSRGHGLRNILEDCARDADITLNVAVEADSYSTLKNLVKTGHGMTILPLAPVYNEVIAGNLSHCPLSDPTPTRRLMMSFPSDRPTTRLARFAGQTMTTTAQQLVKEGIWAGSLGEEQNE